MFKSTCGLQECLCAYLYNIVYCTSLKLIHPWSYMRTCSEITLYVQECTHTGNLCMAYLRFACISYTISGYWFQTIRSSIYTSPPQFGRFTYVTIEFACLENYFTLTKK